MIIMITFIGLFHFSPIRVPIQNDNNEAVNENKQPKFLSIHCNRTIVSTGKKVKKIEESPLPEKKKTIEE